MKNTADIPLVRFLAQAGLGSRRYCDSLIQDGAVTINGKVATAGERVRPGVDAVKVNGEIADQPPVLLYLLLNKPKGYLVSDSDPEGRPLAKELLPDFNMRLFPVGRLDFQTEGALLYTNDGLWANNIAHPRNTVPKTYLAKVRNIPTRATLKRWTDGIRDKGQVLKATQISIEKKTQTNAWLMITLTGGANRQVRRMGQATGHPVVKLIRISVGDVNIDDLQVGETRDLTVKEVKSFTQYKTRSPSKNNDQNLSNRYKKRITTRKNRKRSSKGTSSRRQS